MRKIRVLVVDDSAVMRRMIADAFAHEADIEIAGTAANGRAALEKIAQAYPDLVTLDVEMPEMDGLETVRAIHDKWPRLPVIMLSSLTERGAATTLEALRLGASDYVAKPSSLNGESMSGYLQTELLPKIRALCPGLVQAPAAAPVAIAPPVARARIQPAAVGRAKIVAIGVSTGGPNALHALIPHLPGNLPVPVVIVQHMPKVFTRLLAEQLAKHSALQVREGLPGASIGGGQVWIAPGGKHMALQRQGSSVQIVTNEDPPENSCRPAVDVLFRSVAACYGRESLAVILTGMGKDGVAGCEKIIASGGQVIIQDEASAVVWGMPGSVVQAGLAHQVVLLDQMAEEICRRVGMGAGNRAKPLAPVLPA